ncbi:hypothetical protein GCM10010347_19550 [Streptomyces cirratus]|uniref:Uncharacterized protein n=1 Tax=Streptomyces cirratus TaxID=68187 RepID=A0ABQ3ES19_9ACTN|nr:hypothetical protein GCM10010347_19550 [Streptomyces cirratus]
MDADADAERTAFQIDAVLLTTNTARLDDAVAGNRNGKVVAGLPAPRAEGVGDLIGDPRVGLDAVGPVVPFGKWIALSRVWVADPDRIGLGARSGAAATAACGPGHGQAVTGTAGSTTAGGTGRRQFRYRNTIRPRVRSYGGNSTNTLSSNMILM